RRRPLCKTFRIFMPQDRKRTVKCQATHYNDLRWGLAISAPVANSPPLKREPIMAEIIDIAGARTSALARGCQVLADGEPVAMPTETVYGLAADATNPDAIARIY